MFKRLLIILLLLIMLIPQLSFAEGESPSIINVEVVSKIEEPLNPDVNDDQIVDLFDIVKAVKNKIVDYVQEIIQFYGDKD